MDAISVYVTIYSARGSEIVSEYADAGDTNTTMCSATAKVKYKLDVGFNATGDHYASHNGDFKNGTTSVNW